MVDVVEELVELVDLVELVVLEVEVPALEVVVTPEGVGQDSVSLSAPNTEGTGAPAGTVNTRCWPRGSMTVTTQSAAEAATGIAATPSIAIAVPTATREILSFLRPNKVV